MRLTLWLSLMLLLAIPTPGWAEGSATGLRVPPGFEVTEFADSKLANDIFSMTLDPHGRIVVSGRGYIRILVDDDNDGRADRAIDFADGPKDGAQGLLWEGTSLYFSGDGGLRRYRDDNGDDHADGPSELIRAVKTGGEHDTHAIRRGPDGRLYLLCGNGAGINRTFAQLPTSPIKDPIAGAVLRFSSDLKQTEILADGFRNAYDMDFNADGELFTFDSDNERCVSLPWYEPIRFYHVVPGGHYGWLAPQRAEFWRLPPYACDVVPPLLTLGRGSPTGVVCYRHTQFPESYRGGFFLLDWTFGRVYFVALRRAGASYACEKQVFLETVGEEGFAPTAALVHPATGDLFIAIGGRGTRGAVYRIRYPKGLASPSGTTATLPPRSLDWQSDLETTLPRQAAGDDAQERLRALVALQRHRSHLATDTVTTAIQANWDQSDRLLRQHAAALVATLDPPARQTLGRQAHTALQQLTFAQGSLEENREEAFTRALSVLADRGNETAVRLEAVRVVQEALGGLTTATLKGTVWEGYSPRAVPLDRERVERVAVVLRQVFPAGDVNLDRELSRTLAVIEDDEATLPGKVGAQLTDSSDPIEDIHYLIVLARLRGPRSAALTQHVAGALLALDEKLARLHLNRDRNWPLRVAELHAELAHKDPALNAAILDPITRGRRGSPGPTRTWPPNWAVRTGWTWPAGRNGWPPWTGRPVRRSGVVPCSCGPVVPPAIRAPRPWDRTCTASPVAFRERTCSPPSCSRAAMCRHAIARRRSPRRRARSTRD